MMRSGRWLFVFVAFSFSNLVWADPADVPGAKDHQLFSRFPGYRISVYEEKPFESHSFYDAKHEELKVEGRLVHIRYALKDGATEPSRIQILRNYEGAFQRIGGTILISDYDGQTFMKLSKSGKELWVHVGAYITSEWDLFILEKAAMAQDVVANAAVFSNDIKTTGHAAVYGIYFDTGKAEIKPQSELAMGEIAKLLKSNPGLKLLVVGHTDNVGNIEANMKLSQARADAVVRGLVTRHGIPADSLKGYGVGQLSPVATNDTDEGRAKNRRVELVKQ